MANKQRLIDANALKSEFEWLKSVVNESSKDEVMDVMQRIDNAPTVDAVEVVRCKDCMYYDAKRHRCDHPNLNYDVECYDQWIDTEPDDFCSYGERREDNEADCC